MQTSARSSCILGNMVFQEEEKHIGKGTDSIVTAYLLSQVARLLPKITMSLRCLQKLLTLCKGKELDLGRNMKQ